MAENKTDNDQELDEAKPLSLFDKKMKELLDAGALTQEEFDAKKKELLNQ